MTTIVNTPANHESSSSTGALIGLVLLIVFAFLIFFYGLPALRNSREQAPTNVNVEAPQGVQVPENIDINVNQNPAE